MKSKSNISENSSLKRVSVANLDDADAVRGCGGDGCGGGGVKYRSSQLARMVEKYRVMSGANRQTKLARDCVMGMRRWRVCRETIRGTMFDDNSSNNDDDEDEDDEDDDDEDEREMNEMANGEHNRESTRRNPLNTKETT